jgi:opacity protein-like surface antigen
MIARTKVWMLMAAVVMLVPSVASAEMYAAIRVGPGFTSDTKQGIAGGEDVHEFKSGFTGGVALGYSFFFGLRAEGEFGVVRAPVVKDGGVPVEGTFTNYLFMANALFDFKQLTPIKPYVGLGLGLARVNEEHTAFADPLGRFFNVSETRNAFAWQGRAGVAYELNRWIDISLGYRFVHIEGGTNDVGPVNIRTDALRNHSGEVGLTFKF